MASESLKQKLELVLNNRGHKTIDVYAKGTIVLYSGKPIGSMGSGMKLGSTHQRSKLTIRNFPASGVQLHIHEGPDGTAHLKTHKNEYINVNSYDAAMMDYRMDKLNLPKYRR